jgi:Mrp family chromosome partitioning ATPase
LLVGEVDSLDDVLQPTEVEGLWVLPSGPLPPNTAELLGSPRMLELLDELSERADIVLLDSPPVLAVTDASILASMATGTIMVVEVGQTRLDACVQGVEALRKVGGNLLGVALNRLDVKRRGYYYYYHYYHAYDDDPKGNGQKGGAAHRSARTTGRKGQNDSGAQGDSTAQAEPTNSEAPKTRHHSARKTRLTFKLAAFNLLHHKEHRKSSQDQRERDA